MTDAPSQPIQKRRRVTRACDECRRKKIKCDGKQPCTHCSVYSYECTYDKPSNRRRNPAPQYIEALEGRLQRAEALLRKFIPDVDLADPNLDPSVQQEFHNRESARAQSTRAPSAQLRAAPANEAQLTSMIDSIGQLDLDERGGWDFHGNSSGSVFLKRMRENFRGLLGPQTKLPFLPRADRPQGVMSLDAPSPGSISSFANAGTPNDLPPKEQARSLCYYSLSCATCLVRIVHVPSFYAKFEAIYDKNPETLSLEESRFLGLVYAVLALGCMYKNLDDSSSNKTAYKDSLDEGLKYYRASRALLQDVTECRDLTTLQGLLFLILFLQATANLSACYAFVGIALRSALRMGLHRHLQHAQIGPIEQETRRRVFFVIRQMDIYVSTLLGFPLLLHGDDIDQAYPTEIDDDFITPQGLMRPPPGAPSFFQAFNAHTRLMEILTKITKYVYPMRGIDQSMMKDGAASAYTISYTKIKEIEADLHEWFEKLPQAWRPSADGPVEVVRVRHLLRFSYAHVQLVLYRPFLHYVSPRLSQGNKIDDLSYACAAAAISVSRNIVHIGLEIRKQQVLSGPYWFMLYTEFFAVLSLVFYAIENPEKPGSSEVLADAHAGRQMIADLASKSMSAERVTSALKHLFDQLPERLDQMRGQKTSGKRRTTPLSKTPSSQGQQTINNSRGTGPAPNRSYGTPNPRASVDPVPHVSEPAYSDTSFTASIQEFLPFDMSSRATPDSTSTASSRQVPYLAQSMSFSTPMNKVDSLMFPSEDPFAYPNQPMMELGYQDKSPQMSMAGQASDANFFLTSPLDDLDSQLLGQPPPYMMHQPQGATGMGMSPTLYDPGNLLGLHVDDQPQQSQQQPPPQQHHQPAPQQPHPPPGPSLSQHRRARQQERQIQQMFSAQGMQPDWGSFFGGGRGGFQGM
ncbi:hypothetical protein CC79DRAFT_1280031 [Sarocladium strictum]